MTSAAFQPLIRRASNNPAMGIWLYTEAWDPHGWRGRLRDMRYKVLAGRIANRLDGVLATGKLASNQFSRLVDPNDVHEFGYYTATTGSSRMPEVRRPGHFVFVGSVNRNKRVWTLVKALKHTKHSLDILGTGPLVEELQVYVRRQGLEDRVKLLGVVSNRETMKHMARASALILPSRYDGWGAVVNEALLQGTPVIVSSSAGAASLVTRSRGAVVNRTTPRSLAAAMADVCLRLDQGDISYDEIREWAERNISPEAAAIHLSSLLGGAKC